LKLCHLATLTQSLIIAESSGKHALMPDYMQHTADAFFMAEKENAVG
jgi:hypothetical protein